MAKTTAWLATLIGVVLLLDILEVQGIGTPTSGLSGWIITLAVLVVGITKLIRNYSSRR